MLAVTVHGEELTTGWEPSAPVDDTLLRRFLFHQAAIGQVIALAAGGRALDCADFAASDLRYPSGYWNAATLLRPPADWSAVLDEIETFFTGGTGQAILWSAWPTPDLRSRGWELSGHPPLLARPPLALAPIDPSWLAASDAEARQRGVEVALVTTSDQLATWERVAAEAYPLPELLPVVAGSLVPPALLDEERIGFYVGSTAGEPSSAAASFVSHGIGSFAFAATLPSARGQGHWHRHATARLHDHPDLWMTGLFSDFSRPLAEHLGFLPLLRLTLWIFDRGATR